MKHRRNLLFPFFFLFFAVSSILVLPTQSFGSPIWMTEGSFVQYEFNSSGIVFQNKTSVPFDPDASVTWRWECVEINGDMVKLNVSLRFTGETQTVHISKEVSVNTTNRQVFLSNGTLIGTTYLWAKSNPNDGEEIIVWDVSPDKIVGTIKFRGFWANTPQGGQKIYHIDGEGTINGLPRIFGSAHDVDTGILIGGMIDSEATLLALNVDSVLVSGTFSFTDTNIDLGPRELWPEILGLLPILVGVIIFLVVFVIFYYRRKKRRHH